MKKKLVPASLLGQVVRCPYAASRDRQGAVISEKDKILREKGDQYHNSVNEACVSAEKNSSRIFVIILVVIVVIVCISLF
ncbi:hypothetical protein A1QO_00655 [Vibrio genomosp. F10 str. ZF-129]|uniref:Uncharacterized protein n=1 Tax=Vibrio genomosp. F10 str. ZF-129 TaxID=1187848 RepID=A0A1E5BGA6_9VIBR|nr:hypothetical protein A1QO_00655 [Vibrio genomosp. F10 str. ZF-129]